MVYYLHQELRDEFDRPRRVDETFSMKKFRLLALPILKKNENSVYLNALIDECSGKPPRDLIAFQ